MIFISFSMLFFGRKISPCKKNTRFFARVSYPSPIFTDLMQAIHKIRFMFQEIGRLQLKIFWLHVRSFGISEFSWGIGLHNQSLSALSDNFCYSRV